MTDFSAIIGNSNVFSAQKQVVSKKKNRNRKFKHFFRTSQLRHPISYGEGCFQFFTKNRPQKHLKRAIFHTSQANGEGSSPPPAYATDCNKFRTNEMCNLQKHSNPFYTWKWLIFEKISAPFYYLLIDTTYCLLSSNRKKIRCIVLCQYKVLLIYYCTVIVIVGRK